MSVGWVAAGAAVVGGAMSANASKKASKAQERAANEANQTNIDQFEITRSDNLPWRTVGGNALSQLAYATGTGGTPLVDNSTGIPRPNWALYNSNPAYRQEWDRREAEHQAEFGRGFNHASDIGRLDHNLRLTLGDNGPEDPAFGALNRDFTREDFDADPVAQLGLEFGLNEGTKGINRQMAAGGSLNSGATLKALTRFGNDYGNTKGNESFNRFESNKTNKFNRLAGLAGVGQTANAANQQAGQVMANNVSQNQIGVGNARAASAIGVGNAITGAIGQGVNMYQQNQLMNRMSPQQYGVAQQPGVTGWNSQG